MNILKVGIKVTDRKWEMNQKRSIKSYRWNKRKNSRNQCNVRIVSKKLKIQVSIIIKNTISHNNSLIILRNYQIKIVGKVSLKIQLTTSIQ